ncbi:hypothetical protein [Paenibacillus daejeonensis]|uniref:hypothetical protein n=1 Tax=Paenibacillus daejeonensis TaxID=135193 RepID=UPI000379D04E|nr:hypothetical protein [Paenibacillus daejeonensis]
MPYTKAVIIDPYFDKPSWIVNDVFTTEYMILSSASSSHEVELFLTHLFGYNHINVEQSLSESYNELFEQEQVALSGGIAFFDDEHRVILPSCCCGLEDLIDVKDSVTNRQSPWLGHDPSPGITYASDQALVWPDDPESYIKSDVITFLYAELIDQLELTKIELQAFIDGPLYNWIDKENREVAHMMKDKMKIWFLE